MRYVAIALLLLLAGCGACDFQDGPQGQPDIHCGNYWMW